MKKIKCAIIISIIMASAPFLTARAAEFVLQTTEPLAVGRPFTLKVMFDAGNVDINAVSGELAFPIDLFDVVTIKNGESIVNFWIEPPSVDNGKITFSGMMPGGFDGKNGPLFSIVMRPKLIGSGVIAMRNMSALLNNGLGTPSPSSSVPMPFAIASGGGETAAIAADTTPPLNFSPQVSSNDNLFDGAKFLVFVTQDKDSGIDHYEVQESRGAITKDDAWIFAQSPYPLKDQGLRSYISVKAVDKAGNIQIVQLLPENKQGGYASYQYWCMILLISITAIILISWKVVVRLRGQSFK